MDGAPRAHPRMRATAILVLSYRIDCGTPPKKSTLILMDSRGKQFSSEEFARFLGDYEERNPLPVVFAIGPADGFSQATRSAAQHTLSLGTMTMAHELARVVLLEQVYRALTILKGHPYHSGH